MALLSPYDSQLPGTSEGHQLHSLPLDSLLFHKHTELLTCEPLYLSFPLPRRSTWPSLFYNSKVIPERLSLTTWSKIAPCISFNPLTPPYSLHNIYLPKTKCICSFSFSPIEHNLHKSRIAGSQMMYMFCFSRYCKKFFKLVCKLKFIHNVQKCKSLHILANSWYISSFSF